MSLVPPFAPVRPQCIITGCALVIGDEPCHYWGDLHLMSDGRRPGTYVFNASCNAIGRPYVQNNDSDWNTDRNTRKVINVPASAARLEFRGVFVIPVEAATLNDHAVRYVVEGGLSVHTVTQILGG